MCRFICKYAVAIVGNRAAIEQVRRWAPNSPAEPETIPAVWSSCPEERAHEHKPEICSTYCRHRCSPGGKCDCAGCKVQNLIIMLCSTPARTLLVHVHGLSHLLGNSFATLLNVPTWCFKEAVASLFEMHERSVGQT